MAGTSSVGPQSPLECLHPATLICRSSSRILLILEPSLLWENSNFILSERYQMLLCFCRLPCLTARKNGALGSFISAGRWLLNILKYCTGHHCVDFRLKWSLLTIFLAFSGSCAFLGEPNKHFPAINGISLEDHVTPTQLSLSSLALKPKCTTTLSSEGLPDFSFQFSTLEKDFFLPCQCSDCVRLVSFARFVEKSFPRFAARKFRHVSNSLSLKILTWILRWLKYLWILRWKPDNVSSSYYSPLTLRTVIKACTTSGRA